MQIDVEKLPKSTVKLTVRIEPAEMGEYLDVAARQLSDQVNVPGFRKGRAPRSVLAQRVGPEYLAQQGREIAVQDSYYQAVKKHDLKPLTRPETDLPSQAAHLERDGLTYSAVVSVMPQVVLGDYKSVKVKPATVDYSDKLVEETLGQLRKSQAEFKDVDRPAAKGDRIEIDFVGRHKGEEVEGAKSENHPLILGEDSFMPGFADNLVKLRTGDTKKFKIKFPKDYREKGLAGQKVEFTVTAKSVQEQVLPDLDEAYAKKMGAKSLADLRQRLADNLRQEKEAEAQRETEMAVLEKVMDQSTVEIPEIIVEEELGKMLAEYRQSIERQGLPFDKYLEQMGKTEADIREESRPEAEKRAKMSLVLNAVQAQETLKPAAKEVQAELERQAAAAPDQETMERIQTDDFRHYVEHILGNRLAVTKLVEYAT